MRVHENPDEMFTTENLEVLIDVGDPQVQLQLNQLLRDLQQPPEEEDGSEVEVLTDSEADSEELETGDTEVHSDDVIDKRDQQLLDCDKLTNNQFLSIIVHLDIEPSVSGVLRMTDHQLDVFLDTASLLANLPDAPFADEVLNRSDDEGLPTVDDGKVISSDAGTQTRESFLASRSDVTLSDDVEVRLPADGVAWEETKSENLTPFKNIS